MTFLKFSEAKNLMRKIAKENGFKDVEDWNKFTESNRFGKFSKLIPKKPWIYYPKANVLKRKKKEEKN